MKILGIESSCDETTAAVVEDGERILSQSISSSINEHVKYGGVVPEVAARSHIEVIVPVIDTALSQANCTWNDIDAIAVTYGAGLGGSLLVGGLTARSLAIVFGKPLYAVNHVEAHVYSNFLTSSNLPSIKPRTSQPTFPMLAVIVSGGHTQLALFRNHFDYTLLGQTQDDAIGEAFDKVAKILGLPYPGGPSIAQAASRGNPYAYKLPKPRMPGYDFSFSGLKTAVLRLAQAEIEESYDFPSIKLSGRLNEAQKVNIAASFEHVAVEYVVDKVKQAFNEFAPSSLVIAGGVAANSQLRLRINQAIPIVVEYPDLQLCTDNGAMVATLGYFMASLKQPTVDPYTLDIQPNLSM
jgi:N6-L-threonylcarbamoyladenine synthase